MKADDLEYLFLRAWRCAKGDYFKARQKRWLTLGKLLRASGFVFLAVSLLTVKPLLPPAAATDIIVTGKVKGETASKTSPFADLITPFPRRIPDSSELGEITAKAALFVDALTSVVLYEKNSDFPLPLASTTKIMTALVAFRSFALESVAVVPEECLSLSGAKMGLKKGEQITVESLLYGLLVASASDAACVLSNYGGFSTATFVGFMNSEAERLGAKNTHFGNAVGLDEPNGRQRTTAADLLKITQEALKIETFRKTVARQKITVSSVDKVFWHELVSTNDLLEALPGTVGVKTGWTEEARGCLVSLYRRGESEVLGVVLGSEDRFEETEAILDWIFKVYRWP